MQASKQNPTLCIETIPQFCPRTESRMKITSMTLRVQTTMLPVVSFKRQCENK